MFELELELELELDDAEYSCVGLVFKAEVQEYLDKRNKYVLTYKMGLLSRSSCKCISCQILYDCYLESCSSGCWPILPNDIQNGSLYGIKITNQHIDWETGQVDDYDMEFVELNAS